MNTTQTQTYERAVIAHGSMGNYLDAPGYPTHKYYVEMDLNREKENRGSMNLDYALTQDYISPTLKERITQLITEWNNTKLPITDPVIQEWIKDCNRHFGEVDAVKHIQEFYPEFTGMTL